MLYCDKICLFQAMQARLNYLSNNVVKGESDKENEEEEEKPPGQLSRGDGEDVTWG